MKKDTTVLRSSFECDYVLIKRKMSPGMMYQEVEKGITMTTGLQGVTNHTKQMHHPLCSYTANFKKQKEI